MVADGLSLAGFEGRLGEAMGFAGCNRGRRPSMPERRLNLGREVAARAEGGAKLQRMSGWVLYLLRCGDGTLYTGVTNRLEARLDAHRKGKGARYTRGRGPLEVIHVEPCEGRGAALRREHAVKKLVRRDKLLLARRRSPA